MAFNNAQKFTIGSAKFSADRHHHHYGYGHHPQFPSPDSQAILNEARAAEAPHTSRTAEYAPKCKPGSRAKVIRDILDWAPTADGEGGEVGRGQGGGDGGDGGDDVMPKTTILWFHGPAGGGKTCIMREVSVRLQRLGRLAGSYFFSSRIGGLDSERPFIATIAHQLAILCPYFKAELLRVISAHPNVFEESLHSQVERVIYEPLESSAKISAESLDGRWLAIVVHGFDECQTAVERSNLLSVLHGLATATRGARFLVVLASRSELDLRQAFDCQPLASITRVLRLQDYDGIPDVRNFFCDEFCRIRETHPAKEVIPKTWPVEAILNTLVDNSSGLYIYPATLIKYIDDPRRSPVTLLDEVMNLNNRDRGSANPLAELDSLYRHILSRPWVDRGSTVRLLHYIMVINQMSPKDSGGVGTPCFLDRLLAYDPGEVAMGLCDLHCIVRVPSATEEGPIYFFHKTLAEFLASARRADCYHRPLYQTHAEVAEACMSHCKGSGSSPSGSDETFKNVLVYSSVNWWRHIQLAFEDFPGTARRALAVSTWDFDPQKAWKVEVMSSRSVCVWKRRDKIHRTICKNGPCIPLCRNTLRLEAVGEKFETFYNTRLAEARAMGQPWATRKAIKQSRIPANIFFKWFSSFLQRELGDGRLPLDLNPMHTSSHDPSSHLPTHTPSQPLAFQIPHEESPSEQPVHLVLDPPTSVSKPRALVAHDVPSESQQTQHETLIPLTEPIAQASTRHWESAHPTSAGDRHGKLKRGIDDTYEDAPARKMMRKGDDRST